MSKLSSKIMLEYHFRKTYSRLHVSKDNTFFQIEQFKFHFQKNISDFIFWKIYLYTIQKIILFSKLNNSNFNSRFRKIFQILYSEKYIYLSKCVVKNISSNQKCISDWLIYHAACLELKPQTSLIQTPNAIYPHEGRCRKSTT